MYGGTSELGSRNCNLRNQRPAFGPGPKHSLLTAYNRQQEKRPVSQGTSSFQKSLDLGKFYLAYKICTWLNHLHFAMPAYFTSRCPPLLMPLTLISQESGLFSCYKYSVLPHAPPPVKINERRKTD